MRIIDILNSECCKKLFLEVQNFVKLSLSDYNNSLENGDFDYSSKDIFDFVWGTVEFSKSEICVLDSPLLQRLRKIHHLGFADIVYCNANSSRFSHTIGVTEVAGRMARMISRKLEKNESPYDFIETVRLAAIFHDTGHMFYSHVSELYFSFDVSFPRYRELTEAKAYFCENTSSNVSLHEMLSVMIVNSPETIRLLKNISPYMEKSRLTSRDEYEQLAEYISSLIIGIPVDRMILPYSSIINSSIDADKLDYLSRDSESTKVPIAVDIARIIQKLDVVNLRQIEYPAIWNDSKRDDEPLKIMAIKNSAKKVFWQLSNARSSMYESVYYHHKVLTAESMFRYALRKLYINIPIEEISFTDILQWTDDIFYDYWDKIILLDSLSKDNKQEVSKIIKCIRDRRLYKRVAAFSRDSFKGELSSIKRFFRNIIQNPLSNEYKKFVEEMNVEYNKIHELMDCHNGEHKTPLFMFIYSKYDAMASMPIQNGNGFCIWSSSLMKQETMEAGKKSKQEQFYLVTDCKDRAYVYLALEKVLLRHGITQMSKETLICSKVSFEEMNKKRMLLFEKDYYKSALTLLPEDIFVQILDESLVKSVLDKYSSFLGTDSCKINNNNLMNFLRQFLWLELTNQELISLLDGVLRLLNAAYYIDRESFSKPMSHLTEKLSDIKGGQKHVIMLGSQFDSANHLMYYFNDMSIKKNLIFDGSVEVALDNNDNERVLCFFDDGAYSGMQVISIFQEFMGVSEKERTTNEHHVDELSDENKEKLKKSRIILMYLCFNNNSEGRIIDALKKLGIERVQIYYSHDLSIKIFDREDVFKTAEQKELVKNCLKEIGETIIESKKKTEEGKYKERWSEKRVKEAALGYNDAQQMVVFSTNIPTYSISAFWQNGNYRGNEWVGLFQRTIKE